MAQSLSHGSAHVDRLHHHRGLVAQARAELDDAARVTVADHYDQPTRPGPESPTLPPSGPGAPGTPAAP